MFTRTSDNHEKAWKKTFDEFLKSKDPDHFKEFVSEDFEKYVNGLSRYSSRFTLTLRMDGIKSFLKSRGIEASKEEQEKLAETKQKNFEETLKDGVHVFQSTLHLIESLRKIGIPCAIASSSKNCTNVLRVASKQLGKDLEKNFEIVIDGNTVASEGLKGKPHPGLQ